MSDAPEDVGWFSSRDAAEQAIATHPRAAHHSFKIHEQELDAPLPG